MVIIAVQHQELRHSLRRLIGELFERMIFADDTQSLLDSLASTDPDLLLVELSLPTTNNVNILRVLEKKTVDAPIIVIGDYNDEEATEEALSRGGQSYIPKSDLCVDLIPAILTVLNDVSESAPAETRAGGNLPTAEI